MIWSKFVPAWDKANIIMPTKKVLGEGYFRIEGISPSNWLNPPLGPPINHPVN